MSTTTPIQQLAKVGACSGAVAFVRDGKYKTLQAAWDACPRGEWLLWWAGKKSGEPESAKRKKLVLASCECAREVLPFFEKRYPDDKRVRECMETAEKWAEGEDGVTIEMVREKRRDAYAAAAAAAWADAAHAAHAAYAACAAYAAFTGDAGDAAYAAYAAADAAAADRTEMRLRCANIVRKHYPKVPR